MTILQHVVSFVLYSLVTVTCEVPDYALYPLEGDNRRCIHDRANSMTFNLTDGTRDRCFLAVPPQSWSVEQGPLPVLLLFHGATGYAENCGDIPDDYGYTCSLHFFFFLLICSENLSTTTLLHI